MSRLSQVLLIAVCAAGGWLIAADAQEQDQAESNPAGEQLPAPAAQADAAQSAAIDLTAFEDLKRAARLGIESKLQKPVTFQFKDEVLRDVLAELGRAGGIGVWIDSEALTDEGVLEEEPVTIEFKDITIEQALGRVLDPLQLTWVIEDEVLQVTTRAAGDERLSTRVYDVGPLLKLKPLADDPAAQADDLDNVVFTQFGEPPSKAGFSKPWIVAAVEEVTVGPWEDIDGTGGTVRLVRNLLVVRQTQEAQTEVGRLLEILERAADGALERGSAVVRPASYPQAEDARIHKVLTGKTSLDFQDRPLKSAFEEIANRSGVTVIIDEQALTDEGVNTDAPVTLHVADISWQSALHLLLKPLELTFVVEDGALKVTTRVAADDMRFIVVHDIRDLSDAGLDGPPLIQAVLNCTTAYWEDTAGVGGVIRQPVSGILLVRQTANAHAEVGVLLSDLRRRAEEHTAQAEPAREEPARRQAADPTKVVTRFYPVDPLLVEHTPTATGQPEPDGERPARTAVERAILTFVAPETWKAAGQGGDGMLERINDLLVIRQTAGTHEEVREFLRNLAAAARAAYEAQHVNLNSAGGFSGGMGGGGFGGGGGGFFQVPAREAESKRSSVAESAP